LSTSTSARRRYAVAVLLAMAFVLLSGIDSASPPAVAEISCGTWRWPVKTLSDPARKRVHFAGKRTTVVRLRHRTPPSDLRSSTPRKTKVEFHTWRLRAIPRKAKMEGDGDIHLVIGGAKHRHKTMIVEFPQRSCVEKPFKRHRIVRARRRFLDNCGSVLSSSWTQLRGSVNIEGVGFWDAVHAQTGAAPNGIELHPVLDFDGRCSRRSA
jgi:hypothetical protein